MSVASEETNTAQTSRICLSFVAQGLESETGCLGILVVLFSGLLSPSRSPRSPAPSLLRACGLDIILRQGQKLPRMPREKNVDGCLFGAGRAGSGRHGVLALSCLLRTSHRCCLFWSENVDDSPVTGCRGRSQLPELTADQSAMGPAMGLGPAHEAVLGLKGKLLGPKGENLGERQTCCDEGSHQDVGRGPGSAGALL